MKLKLFLIALLSITIAAAGFIYTCYLDPNYNYRKTAQAAFVLSFDDQYVVEWYNHRDLFKKYHVHATFFVIQPDALTPDEVLMLKALAADGHEIASHGAIHLNSLQYIETHGLPKYIQDEVIPSIKSLQKLGFAPVTFAYPYGANSRYTDYELSKYFYLLRGDSWKVKKKEVDELDRIFYKYDGSRVVNGLGIDHGSGVTIQDIKKAFARAIKNNEAVVIYAHAINNSESTYSISPQKLEEIFKAAQDQKLASLTFKDLVL